jgi:hypothetical protein
MTRQKQSGREADHSPLLGPRLSMRGALAGYLPIPVHGLQDNQVQGHYRTRVVKD